VTREQRDLERQGRSVTLSDHARAFAKAIQPELDRISRSMGKPAGSVRISFEGVEAMHAAALIDGRSTARLEDLIVRTVAGPHCRVCGCTEDQACPGGCAWVTEGLCTACGIRFVIPMRVSNPLNQSSGNTKWAAIQKTKLHRDQRDTGRAHTLGAIGQARAHYGRAPKLVPALVRFTRISTGRLDDDNLGAALKHIRDGIAQALKVDDGGPFVRFEYAQRRGTRGYHALLVEIERVP